jgi:histidinol-phosphate aminotransferase
VSGPLALARPDLLALKAYEPARWDPALVRLHANEAPWRPLADDTAGGLNRYPEPSPTALRARLASLYGARGDCALVGRGSDEGIDLLTRAFCVAGRDAVLVCPPTFGMYAVAARIQGARVVEVPLRVEPAFALDTDGIAAAIGGGVKIVWLCSPNNPTGQSIKRAELDAVLAAAAGRALVVVDEAYVEFSGRASLAADVPGIPHLVVLRTLSKALGLAGARVGTVIAHPDVIGLLQRIIPPYAIAQPSIEATLRVLEPEQLQVARSRQAEIVRERGRLAAALAASPAVVRVWPSDANFVLARFRDADAAFRRIVGAGLLVRDVRAYPGLQHCLRLTVGSPEQNDRVIGALE